MTETTFGEVSSGVELKQQGTNCLVTTSCACKVEALREVSEWQVKYVSRHYNVLNLVTEVDESSAQPRQSVQRFAAGIVLALKHNPSCVVLHSMYDNV